VELSSGALKKWLLSWFFSRPMSMYECLVFFRLIIINNSFQQASNKPTDTPSRPIQFHAEPQQREFSWASNHQKSSSSSFARHLRALRTKPIGLQLPLELMKE